MGQLGDEEAACQLQQALLLAEEEDGSSDGGSGGDPTPRPGGAASRATLLQTLANFLNIFVGTGMQSMPYALMRGGWLALGALLLIMPLFALSGQLIVWAFDLMPSNAPKTYPELGRVAAGRYPMQNELNTNCCCRFRLYAELFGGHIILILVSWRMAGLLLPPGWGPLSPLQLAAAVSTTLQLPLLFVDLRRLSRLAMVGLASSGFLIAMVLSLLVMDPQRQAMAQQPPPTHHLASLGVIQAIGVFALSSTAHSTLPALRIAMQKPSRFPLALMLGFTTMLIGYSAIASAGYWYWGDAASPLAADDLAANSFFTGSRVPIHRVLAALVLVNCLTKVPGLILVLQDMLISFLPHGEATYFHPPKLAYLIRLVLFGCGTLLALTAYRVLGSALSLLGGLASISCSLLLPTAFYSLLSWRRLRLPAKAGLTVLLAVGVALVGLITSSNLCDLLESCRERHSHGGSSSSGSNGGSSSWLPWVGLQAALLQSQG
ncbi:hypothetical protein COHA_010558 [Chlorella ohadii]|uniref:Amino acid transporter transmembrane domain-containing protein n=1 Tax=Chlorella ohadii TaxID=2649997 RepID=A0AAD5DDJ2_9CHLO|nr:hypothetical protein COHA_010558 [Chlorella ohadii]